MIWERRTNNSAHCSAFNHTGTEATSRDHDKDTDHYAMYCRCWLESVQHFNSAVHGRID
jgi:hypothetical protein